MSECQVWNQWQGALKICYFPIGGAAGNCLALRLIFLSISHQSIFLFGSFSNPLFAVINAPSVRYQQV